MLVVKLRTWKTAKKPFSLTMGAARPASALSSLRTHTTPCLSVSVSLCLSLVLCVCLCLTHTRTRARDAHAAGVSRAETRSTEVPAQLFVMETDKRRGKEEARRQSVGSRWRGTGKSRLKGSNPGPLALPTACEQGGPPGAECLQMNGSVFTLTWKSCSVRWDARKPLQGRAHR